MSRGYSWLIKAFWLLGLVSLLAAVVLKYVPALGAALGTTPRGGLVMSVVLFLAALATSAAQDTTPGN